MREPLVLRVTSVLRDCLSWTALVAHGPNHGGSTRWGGSTAKEQASAKQQLANGLREGGTLGAGVAQGTIRGRSDPRQTPDRQRSQRLLITTRVAVVLSRQTRRRWRCGLLLVAL
ncbi:hypothetical protein SNOG_12470 [Parastagonospora nodorum SN15]|uniref:Uncharacterized protein n=1 Tax=Phaeosphaeria nodorum (strain SN15 / ATCC MYA-4574 / FGSC 10173) TaxID=321614 RepID=Q0U6Z4_PHANO|nr:hypothetical protein SNOG_12470 [Parastagonospora nodorum SN15]EAT80283.1 hypothetical protein SNOG_12470 [Parastagonospora nodorum SN15]